ncbi:MAG: hypothetical protein L0L69_07105 [Propionibacterium sp.]|nr:hypothetical protein [Propionibacterium sp.]
MKLTDLYPGARVAISGPGITLQGRVEGVFRLGRPEQTRITVWGQLGGTIIIPADMAHLVTITEVE